MKQPTLATGLLFIHTNDDDIQVERRTLKTMAELAAVLASAEYGYWIQGLGSPGSYRDREVWRNIGRFLMAIPNYEVNLDGTHV